MRSIVTGGALILVGGLGIATGVFPPGAAAELLSRVWPVLLFVVSITIVAEYAQQAGLFDALAGGAARLARGRGVVLWFLVAAIAVVSTVFLSLDTTAVLLTPIVVVLARKVGLNPLPFALSTVWLANTASLLLPVSNLTNLLAEQHLGGIGPGQFAAATWAPEIVGVIVPLLVVFAVFRRDVTARYALPATQQPVDRRLVAVTAGVLAALVVFFLVGVPVWMPAAGAAVVLTAVFVARRPAAVSARLIPVRLIVLTLGLFLAMGAADAAGLSAVFERLAGTGSSLPELLRTAGVGGLSANVANNLPAYLALEPAAQTRATVFALLIGVNAGPLITPWGSLATLLWHQRLTRLDVTVSWTRYLLLGCVVAPTTVVAATVALSLVAG